MTKFKDMTPEEQEVFLAERKEISRQRCATIKAKQAIIKDRLKAQKARVHEGNRFLRDLDPKEVEFGGFQYHDFVITYGIVAIQEQEDAIICRAAYAIKAPSDEYNQRVGHGLIGYRLKEANEWSATIPVPWYLWEAPDRPALKQALQAIIVSRIILNAPEIPQRLTNNIFKQLIRDLKAQKTIEDSIIEV